LQAVAPFHAQFGHHHVGGVGRERRDGLGPVVRHPRLEAGGGQVVGDRLRHLRHVVDDERAELGHVASPFGLAGHTTVTVVPCPGVLCTSICPAWLRTMPAAMARPSPVPSPRALVVKNGSKMAVRFSGGMPVPWSATAMRTLSPGARPADSVTARPGAEASQALSNRFTSTCCS